MQTTSAAAYLQSTSALRCASDLHQPSTAQQILVAARARGAASAWNPPAGQPSLEPPTTTRGHSMKHEETDDLLMQDTALSRALCGDLLVPSTGSYVSHPANKCKCQQADGSPCWQGLWNGDREILKERRQKFFRKATKARSAAVFHKIQQMVDLTETPGTGMWRFTVDTRPVCRQTFLLENPISSSQLSVLQARVVAGKRTAHESSEVVADGAAPVRDAEAPKRLEVVGWYQGYAGEVGDYMPDEQETIVPRRDRHDEWTEYKASSDVKCSYSYFCETVRCNEYTGYIRRARKLANFQGCAKCTEENTSIKRALAKGDQVAAGNARKRRRAHIDDTRGERLQYYASRERGRSRTHTLSLIVDKWDATKTTVPWFERAPGSAWSALKKEVLEQHVVGVLVHGRPSEPFLFTYSEQQH